MTEPILYETHMHTPLCRHAEGEPEAYAERALHRGLDGIIVTCHNPMPGSYGHSGRMTEAQIPEYFAIIERCADAYRGRLDVRAGLECDYFPGYEAYIARTIDAMPLHYIIGSIHPHLAIWRRRFKGNPTETQTNYFNQIAEAAQSRLFDCISHPDLIKNMTDHAWDFERVRDDVARCLDQVAASGVAMELNTSGRLKTIPEMNPTPAMLRMMCERNIPVVLGADAHVPERVSDHFEEALKLLRDCGFTHVSTFLDRQRFETPIDAALARLRPCHD